MARSLIISLCPPHPLQAPLEALGAGPLPSLLRPYRALRALKPLLFVATPALPGSPLLAEIPPSAALHHLYTRAPPELVSPAARAGLTPGQYSAWLEAHGEEETWRGVAATLRAYRDAQQARARATGGAVELSAAYHAMMDVGTAAFGE